MTNSHQLSIPGSLAEDILTDFQSSKLLVVLQDSLLLTQLKFYKFLSFTQLLLIVSLSQWYLGIFTSEKCI